MSEIICVISKTAFLIQYSIDIKKNCLIQKPNFLSEFVFDKNIYPKCYFYNFDCRVAEGCGDARVNVFVFNKRDRGWSWERGGRSAQTVNPRPPPLHVGT